MDFRSKQLFFFKTLFISFSFFLSFFLFNFAFASDECVCSYDVLNPNGDTVSKITKIHEGATDNSSCQGLGQSNPPTYSTGMGALNECTFVSGLGETPPPASSGGTISSQVELPTVKLENPLGEGNTDIRKIFGNSINVVLGILGSLTLGVFIYGAWNWVTSAGYPQRVETGLHTMLFAVIGLFVIFAAYAILKTFIQVVTIG